MGRISHLLCERALDQRLMGVARGTSLMKMDDGFPVNPHLHPQSFA
jgi:hypothetical protein